MKYFGGGETGHCCRKYFGGMKTKRNCGMTSNKSGIIKAMNN
jgi:hypothetical protein